jgi:6-phosphofructokinase 1
VDAIAEQLDAHSIDGVLMIGGWAGYQAAHGMYVRALERRGKSLPIVCLPASINNDLPGSEVSIGVDTALNSIIVDVDKIKQSAVASRRSFVVEVMGHECGYLALVSGLATGAEQAYLPEDGISLADLQTDLEVLKHGFEHGKRLGLIIRSEHADPVYTTSFIKSLFEREGEGLFDVRGAILGHVQQGGDPSPFDRVQATRLASESVQYLATEAVKDQPSSAFVGFHGGRMEFTPLEKLPEMIDVDARRPRRQSWMALQTVARVMAGTNRQSRYSQPADHTDG